MRKEELYILAEKYLAGKATEEEKAQLNEWYEGFDDTEITIPATIGENEPMLEQKMLDRLRASLEKELVVSGSGKTAILRRRPRWIAAAMIIFLLLSGSYVYFKTDIIRGHGSEEFEENEENDEYDGPDKAVEFEIERTRDLTTGKVPWQKLRIAMEQTEQSRSMFAGRVDALSWIERGPDGDFYGPQGNTRPNNDQTGGRIRAAMVDSLDPTYKTVWVGGIDGGLWKTTDITASPASWTLINDFFSNLAIAAICQDPRPGFQNNMYFCTGESYFNADAVRGVGVYKSVDGGASWNFLSSTSAYLNGTRIVCDYQGNVYLGTRGNGLLRSTDGGTSWTNITPSGLNNDICDLEISSTAVAARLHVTTGIFSASGYRYTDIPSTVTSGGWTTATTPFTTFSQRTELGINGTTLYASPDNASHQVPTIWKSTDGGANWAATATQPGGGTWANGQGWYSLSCGVNPSDPQQCIVGGLDCYKTINGGTSWTKISTWVGGPGSGQYVHADQHNIQWWDGGNKLIFTCDGGVHYSADGATTIRDRNKGLRLKQFYSIALHPNQPNYFIAGAQDNGVHRLDHPGLDSSIEVYGGDGMFVAIDQNEPQYQFGSYVYNVYRRSTNNGVSWTTPVNNQSVGRFVNPWDYDNNANIIYACSGAGNYLRWDNPQTGATTNTISIPAFGGGTVAAVHASPYTANTVYFGTGTGGVIRVDNANTATPTGTSINTGAGMPAGYVNCVVTGSDDQHMMVCFTNYGVSNIWVTTNGGANWTAIDGNLPDMPVRWALFHPDTDTKAYIATETGVWETDLINGSSTVWTANSSFPNVRTDMIKYRSSDRTIGAGTHGRGIWTATIPVPGGFSFNSPGPATATCPAPSSMSVTLGTISNGGFSNPITLSAAGNPAGTTVSFAPNPVTPGSNTIVTLNNTNTLTAGSYIITVTGMAAGAPNQTVNLTYTINAGSGPAITAQPSNVTVCAPASASFSITSAAATGFQWQISTDGGGSYNSVSNGGSYSGATTSTLTINPTAVSMNGNRYRCIASTLCGSTTSSAGILTVNGPTAITAQPTNSSVCTGGSTQFCVTATGLNVTYQWQLSTTGCGGPWNNIVAATSNCLTISNALASMNGYAYQVIVTGGCAPTTVTSNCATLTVVTSLSITSQPADVVTCEGSSVNFTVAATGANINYQWQLSTDGGGSYNDVTNGGGYSGATTATLNINPTLASMSGNRYRVNLTSSCGNATSNSALLTVNTLPAITSQPSGVTLCAGSSNTFSITATGTGITYQWQISSNGCSGPWTNIPGATSSSYTLTGITAGQNNTGYRCVVTGTCTPPAISNCALLNVVTSVTITTQPVSQTICEGGNVSFTVAGSGTGIIYQWQVSTDGGGSWNNIPGATSATYTISGVTFAMNNNQYRAQLSNSTCTTPGVSNAAILTVNTLPAITGQPQNATICVGGSNTFSVTATGTGITYQWQLSTDGGGSWSNIPGATSSSYTVSSVVIGMNGYRYRVVVTGTCPPPATSAAAILTVIAPVTITTQPANVELCSGSDATFTVAGSSVPAIIYQWQVSTDGGGSWNNIAGATAASYTITNVATVMNNNRYRVLLSNATCTAPAISGAAILTVRQLPTIGLTNSPNITSLLPGQSTILTATPSASTGGALTTSWYRNGTAFANAGNTYEVNVTNLGSYQAKIQELWPGGLTCFNVSPIITITAAVSTKLFIYPSPNDGTFTVSYYNVGGLNTQRNIAIFDSKGALVYNRKFNITGAYTLIPIDMRGTNTGIYYVVVGDMNGTKLADGKVHIH